MNPPLLSTLFVRHENQDAHHIFQWKKSCFVSVWIKRIHSCTKVEAATADAAEVRVDDPDMCMPSSDLC